MPKIIVDESICIRCNTCRDVCIMGIIEAASNLGVPEILEANTAHCIVCGHCESFCEQNALSLDFLLGEKIKTTPLTGEIDPQALSLYIKKRRTVRHFSSTPVAKELIAQILDTVRYAATGGNTQTVKWMVFYDASEVKRIAALTVDWMRSIRNTDHPLSDYVPAIIVLWESGKDLICHDAPHLLFAHIPENEAIFDPTDAIIALTHFDIAAPAFGIGTCWAGFVKMATDSYPPLKEKLALPEGRKAAYAMMFGYSSYKISSIPRRNPVDISWR
jgi:nitroreductase/NAD-dependent dihydropyrimidine dehydrogenase PreA subunit